MIIVNARIGGPQIASNRHHNAVTVAAADGPGRPQARTRAVSRCLPCRIKIPSRLGAWSQPASEPPSLSVG